MKDNPKIFFAQENKQNLFMSALQLMGKNWGVLIVLFVCLFVCLFVLISLLIYLSIFFENFLGAPFSSLLVFLFLIALSILLGNVSVNFTREALFISAPDSQNKKINLGMILLGLRKFTPNLGLSLFVCFSIVLITQISNFFMIAFSIVGLFPAIIISRLFYFIIFFTALNFNTTFNQIIPGAYKLFKVCPREWFKFAIWCSIFFLFLIFMAGISVAIAINVFFKQLNYLETLNSMQKVLEVGDLSQLQTEHIYLIALVFIIILVLQLLFEVFSSLLFSLYYWRYAHHHSAVFLE